MFALTKVRSGLLQVAGCRVDASRSRGVYFITVPPDRIAHIKLFGTTLLPVVGKSALTGALGGEWDRLKLPFHFHYIYRTIKGRIVDGKEWAETPLNRRRGRERSQDAIYAENAEIDKLIESLRTHGYRSQYECGADLAVHALGSLRTPAELVVGMDRAGRLFQLAGGRHRLAIAHVLGLSEVPAILSLFHSRGLDKLPEKRRLLTGNPEDFRPFDR